MGSVEFLIARFPKIRIGSWVILGRRPRLAVQISRILRMDDKAKTNTTKKRSKGTSDRLLESQGNCDIPIDSCGPCVAHPPHPPINFIASSGQSGSMSVNSVLVDDGLRSSD